MAAGASLVIKRLRVLRDALVPDDDGAGLIADAAAEIMAAVDVVEQELEQVVGLFVVPAHDTLGVGRVDEQVLLPGDGVDGDNGMDGLGDRAAEDGGITVIADFAGNGVGGGVQRLQTLKTLPEGWREPLKSTDGLQS